MHRRSQAGRDHGTGEQRLEAGVGEVEGDQRVDDMVDQLVQRQGLDLGTEDGLGLPQAFDKPVGQGLGDGVLVGEELVERAGRHAGAGGDGIGGGRLEADLGEDLGSCIQDLLDATLAARLPPSPGRSRRALSHRAPST